MILAASEIVWVFYLGTVGMLILAGGLIIFFVAYQKRLLQKQLEVNRIRREQQEKIVQNTIEAQEKERKRIARDLHDEVGAMLSVVKLNVGRMERKADTPLTNLAGETKQYLDEVITQVRRISRSLLPPSLEKMGLFYAIEELGNWVNKSNELELKCILHGEQYRLASDRELALFRISQEALNNALKYANASEIVIQNRFSEKGVAVAVSDNGKGFDLSDQAKHGLGVQNMQSRAELIGALIKIKSAPGKGTRVIILLKNDEIGKD